MSKNALKRLPDFLRSGKPVGALVALGLACLTGCSEVEEPGLQQPNPGQQPRPAPRPGPAPQPGPINVPTDEYDAANHRLLLSDCTVDALVAYDLESGARSIVADTWPWTEPNTSVCISDLVVEAGGERVFAVTYRSFPEPDGSGGSCSGSDVVSIDTRSGEVSELANIEFRCCDDCGDGQEYYALQVDMASERLLSLDLDCDPNFCDNYLTSMGIAADQTQRLQPVFLTDCSPYPDEDACFGAIDEIFGEDTVFDPADPDHRILVLLGDDTVDAIDFSTGAREQVAAVQTVWGDITISSFDGLSVDAEQGRLFLTGSAPGPLYVVVAIELATGDQTLLYDGSPTADGEQLACRPNPAYDTRAKRVILVEQSGGYGCSGSIFAVDGATGVLTRLSGPTI